MNGVGGSGDFTRNAYICLSAQTFKDYQSYCSYSAILCVTLEYSLTPSHIKNVLSSTTLANNQGMI